ncbi:MAG: hypothetical protein FJ302_13285 [Planctomycetes bacterium]|nr:hypothetical protein [Planctomycetota bacterium]
MADEDDDPFELHSRWFLTKLQRAVTEFRRSAETPIDDQLVRFDNLWPQVTSAFRWASAQSEISGQAAELSKAFLACASSDDLLEFRRSPDELRHWSQAAEGAAERFLDDPDKAVFLRQFAEAAMLQSEQLTVVRDTRSKLSTLLSEVELNPKSKNE